MFAAWFLLLLGLKINYREETGGAVICLVGSIILGLILGSMSEKRAPPHTQKMSIR